MREECTFIALAGANINVFSKLGQTKEIGNFTFFKFLTYLKFSLNQIPKYHDQKSRHPTNINNHEPIDCPRLKLFHSVLFLRFHSRRVKKHLHAHHLMLYG